MGGGLKRSHGGKWPKKAAPKIYDSRVLAGSDFVEEVLREEEKLELKTMEMRKKGWQEFDLIFSSSALHWVKDHANLYRHALQALKCGGILYFSFAGAGTCETFITVIKTAMTDYPQYFKDFEWPWYMPDIQEYERLVRQQIINEVHVWGTNADRTMSETELIQWIDQPVIVPFLMPLPSVKRVSFRDQVVETMLLRTRQNEDSHFETFRRINVCGRK